MEHWSPFARDGQRKARAPWARGRRRRSLLPAASGPDAILSDRDAAHAAETARQGRVQPQEAAWERFGSQPVNPPRRQPETGDAILKLAEASCIHGGPVTAADTGRRGELLRMQRAAGDYGTGPAYEPARMR